ncbi:MAG: outer membrane beta-barrel protein [Saprospiraceae bacterium]
MKIWISLFFLVFTNILVINAQTISDAIRQNNKQLKNYTDSLDYFDKLFNAKKIDLIHYQLSIGRLSSELSLLAGNNFEITYPVVDSVTYANYQQETPTKDLTEFEEEKIEMDMPSDQKGSTKAPKIKMPMSARALGMINPTTNKRTKLGINVGIGFTSLLKEVNDYNYPKIQIGDNFYIQHVTLVIKTRLGGDQSKMKLRYGIGLDYVSLKQKEDFKNLQVLNDKPIFVSSTSKDIQEVKLKTKFLKIPLGLDYKISKKFNLRAGCFYNILLSSKEISEFEYSEDEEASVKIEKDFGLNKNVFGLEYAIGYKHFELYFEHSLNSLLNNKADADLTYFKFGLNLK